MQQSQVIATILLWLVNRSLTGDRTDYPLVILCGMARWKWQKSCFKLICFMPVVAFKNSYVQKRNMFAKLYNTICFLSAVKPLSCLLCNVFLHALTCCTTNNVKTVLLYLPHMYGVNFTSLIVASKQLTFNWKLNSKHVAWPFPSTHHTCENVPVSFNVPSSISFYK